MINLTEIITPITARHNDLTGCTFYLGRTRGGYKQGSTISCCVARYQKETMYNQTIQGIIFPVVIE